MANNNQSSLSGLDLLDILFFRKNKAYGAYYLRKSYNKNLRLAMIIGFALILLAFGLPAALKAFAPDFLKEKEKNTRVTELGPPPSIDPNVPPPPPPPKVETPPPPPRPTVKFVPPVVKKDEEVVEEEKIATVEELDKADASTKTQEGDETSTAITVVEDLGAKEAVEEVKEDPEKVFTVVEQKPSFPGGEAEMMKFIYSNIKYPSIARENGVEGMAVITFVVDKQGKIGGIKISRDPGAGCGDEAVRVVKMMPTWLPGKQNGRAVNVQFNLPVKFKLD